MIYFIYYLMALTVFGALSTILAVGKHRTPVTPSTALVTTLWAGVNIVGYVWIIGGLK